MKTLILAITLLISLSSSAQTLNNAIGWTVEGDYKYGTVNKLGDIRFNELTFNKIQEDDNIYYLLTDSTRTLPYSLKFTEHDYKQIFDFSNSFSLQPVRVRIEFVTNNSTTEGNFEIYKTGNYIRFNWMQDIRNIMFIQNSYFECKVEDWRKMQQL